METPEKPRGGGASGDGPARRPKDRAYPFGWHEARRYARKIAEGTAEVLSFERRAARWQVCVPGDGPVPDAARLLLAAGDTVVAVETGLHLDGSLRNPLLTWTEGPGKPCGVFDPAEGLETLAAGKFREGLKKLVAEHRTPPLVPGGDRGTGPEHH